MIADPELPSLPGPTPAVCTKTAGAPDDSGANSETRSPTPGNYGDWKFNANFTLNLLTPGGTFEVRTDVEDRAHQMLEVLERAGLVNPLGPRAFHPPLPDEIPSTRERRYLETNQPVYRARLLRPPLTQVARAHP